MFLKISFWVIYVIYAPILVASVPCLFDTDCDFNANELCNFYEPQNASDSTDGIVGTCGSFCQADTDCPNDQNDNKTKCNRITGICQEPCTSSAPYAGCRGYEYGKLSDKLVCTNTSSGYCAVICNSTSDCKANAVMPKGTVCSKGLCVQPCKYNHDCAPHNKDTGLTCDLTTGGCGVACEPGGKTCENLVLPQLLPSQAKPSPPTSSKCSFYSQTCSPEAEATTGTAGVVTETCVNTQLVAIKESGNFICETLCTADTTCINKNENGKCISVLWNTGGTSPAVVSRKICQNSCTSNKSCGSKQLCIPGADSSSRTCQLVPLRANNQCPTLPAGVYGAPDTNDGFCEPYSCTKSLCTSDQSCVAPNSCKCEDTKCENGRVCISTGNGCTCESSKCPPGENCSSSAAACACDKDTCAPPNSCTSETPSKCKQLCGEGHCKDQEVCQFNSSNKEQCFKTSSSLSCGNGVIEAKYHETCDEGSFNRACSSGCPLNWTCRTPTGDCVPPKQKDGSIPGNGQNGHCSNKCQSICAVYVDSSSLAGGTGKDWKSAYSDIYTAYSKGLSKQTLLGTCTPLAQVMGSLLPSGTKSDPDCPCGYGIWMKENIAEYIKHNPPLDVFGIASGAIPGVQLENSLAIYGGFKGDEKTIYDRTPPTELDENGSQTMGRQYPSGTILKNKSDPIFIIASGTQSPTSGADKTLIPPTVIIDGFQIIDSKGSSTTYCGTKTLPGPPASPLTICPSSTVYLNKVHLTGNSSWDVGGGGAILNLGILKVYQSNFSLNQAGSQGGGAIAHQGSATTTPTATTTVELSTFFGNGFTSKTELPALCTVGGSCPDPGVCPDTGGICGPKTSSQKPQFAAMTPDKTTIEYAGGAISATGAGALTVEKTMFNGNYAYTNGGAIYSEIGGTIKHSQFSGNWASNAGGGIYLSNILNDAATLSNLGFIDNKAYNQGGGGIYDQGTKSTLAKSEFVNNKGLYPLNTPTASEWIGSRSASFPHNDINSVSNHVQYSSKNTGGLTYTVSNPMTASNTDISIISMCPVSAYKADPSNLNCTGKELCGKIPSTLSSFNASDTLARTLSTTCSGEKSKSPCLSKECYWIDSLGICVNKKIIKDTYGNENICGTELFINCKAPTYTNCMKNTSANRKTSGSSGQSVSLGFEHYKSTTLNCGSSGGSRDYHDNSYCIEDEIIGAFQSGCGDSLDCFKSVSPFCVLQTLAGGGKPMKSCLSCVYDSDCINNPGGNVCLAGDCVTCGANGARCPSSNECVLDLDCFVLIQDKRITQQNLYCSNHVCGECNSSGHCSESNLQFCDTNGAAPKCVECLIDQDCGGVVEGVSLTSGDSCVNNKCICTSIGERCSSSNPVCTKSGCSCGPKTCDPRSDCFQVSKEFTQSGFICTCTNEEGESDSSLCASGLTCQSVGKSLNVLCLEPPQQTCAQAKNQFECGQVSLQSCKWSSSGTLCNQQTECSDFDDSITCSQSSLVCDWDAGKCKTPSAPCSIYSTELTCDANECQWNGINCEG